MQRLRGKTKVTVMAAIIGYSWVPKFHRLFKGQNPFYASMYDAKGNSGACMVAS